MDYLIASRAGLINYLLIFLNRLKMGPLCNNLTKRPDSFDCGYSIVCSSNLGAVAT